MRTQGILYYVWGDYNTAELERSIGSAERFGYDYHVHEAKGEHKGLANKQGLFKASPFDVTLFLDIDTEIQGNLDFGFQQADRVACCIAPATNAHLAAEGDFKQRIPKDLPQYNTGVIFFTQAHAPLFRLWANYINEDPNAYKNDQPHFSLACHNLDVSPYVLPRNWNWRRKIRYESKVLHGDLKILHERL